MSNITISASLSTTIDGQVVSSQATNSATAMRVLEVTHDVNAGYYQPVEGSGGTAIFYLFINRGTEDCIIRIERTGDYWRYCIPAGGHVVLSGASASGNDSPISFNPTQISARTASGSTRLYCLVAFHA